MAALLRKGLQLKVVMQPTVAAVAVTAIAAAPAAGTVAVALDVAAIGLVSWGAKRMKVILGRLFFNWGRLVREKSDLGLEIDIFWYLVFKL